MEPKGQPNEQMEEVVLQPTQPKLVSFLFCSGITLKLYNFRIQRPEMEVARAKIYPAECLRMVYLKYFCVRSSVHSDISYSSAFRISVQLSIFPRDQMCCCVGLVKHVT